MSPCAAGPHRRNYGSGHARGPGCPRCKSGRRRIWLELFGSSNGRCNESWWSGARVAADAAHELPSNERGLRSLGGIGTTRGLNHGSASVVGLRLTHPDGAQGVLLRDACGSARYTSNNLWAACGAVAAVPCRTRYLAGPCFAPRRILKITRRGIEAGTRTAARTSRSRPTRTRAPACAAARRAPLTTDAGTSGAHARSTRACAAYS